MKIVANFKDKMTENKECQCLTKYKNNSQNSSKYDHYSSQEN